MVCAMLKVVDLGFYLFFEPSFTWGPIVFWGSKLSEYSKGELCLGIWLWKNWKAPSLH